MYGDILQYIAHAILVKCGNVCDIDIAGPNIAKLAIILKYCPTLHIIDT